MSGSRPPLDDIQACRGLVLEALKAARPAMAETSKADVRAAFRELGARGFIVPGLASSGVGKVDYDKLGIVSAVLGATDASLLSVYVVNSMLAHALMRFGTEAQIKRILPAIIQGKAIGAFALSEEGAGSDTAAVSLSATQADTTWILNGSKRWISGGLLADHFLVYARTGSGFACFVVEAGTEGLTQDSEIPLVAFQDACLARLEFKDCRVAGDCQVGRNSIGHSHVVASCLDLGRFCLAWGAVGMLEECHRIASLHTRQRKQFGHPLIHQPLVKKMLTEIIAATESSRALCLAATAYRVSNDPLVTASTLLAKYHSSGSLARAASLTMQVLGARGFIAGTRAQEIWRDSKVLEIIEGNNQLIETLLPDFEFPTIT